MNAIKKDERKSFCSGINFYKLFWIFMICSVLGFILETVWCFFYHHGRIYSRKSLIFGPFSIIYGFGGVIMALLVHFIKKKEPVTIFAVTTCVGIAFEFFCSLFQEAVFGTRSWDYTGDPFCIAGRANVLFACGWGILGVLFMKGILPFFDKMIEKIPNTSGLIVTWALLFFMGFNIFLSATAVKRQSDRREGIKPKNSYEQYLDRKYTDDVLKKIYANMKAVE